MAYHVGGQDANLVLPHFEPAAGDQRAIEPGDPGFLWRQTEHAERIVSLFAVLNLNVGLGLVAVPTARGYTRAVTKVALGVFVHGGLHRVPGLSADQATLIEALVGAQALLERVDEAYDGGLGGVRVCLRVRDQLCLRCLLCGGLVGILAVAVALADINPETQN